MTAPDWVRWTLAVMMMVAAGYHLSRGVRRSARLDAELAHGAAGVAMAAMLAGSVATTDARALAVAFALPLLWFAWRSVHVYVLDGPHFVLPTVQVAVGSAAMVYMLAVLTSAHGMSDMSPVSVPVLAWGLAIATVAVTGWTVRRLRPGAVATGCQAAMSLTTVVMLITM